MPFPRYTIKRLLGLIPWRVRDGWEDLGKARIIEKRDNGLPPPFRFERLVQINYYHDFCDSFCRRGKEDGGLFAYCPKCSVKIKQFWPMSHILERINL